MPTLTSRETETLAAACQSIMGPVKIDFEKVASITGYKTAASAYVSFLLIKKKLNLDNMNGTRKGGSVTHTNNDDEATTRTPRKRGRKPKIQTNADENAEYHSQEPEPQTVSGFERVGDGNGRVDGQLKKRGHEDMDDPPSTPKSTTEVRTTSSELSSGESDGYAIVSPVKKRKGSGMSI